MNQSVDFDNSGLAEFASANALVAGVDEVGRGALFGSVVAATVALPLSALPQLIAVGVKDSKKLSAKQRQKLVPLIENIATAYCVSLASAAEIDELNILQASLLAMKRSILGLNVTPDICLIDGKFIIPSLPLAQKAVIKGDAKSPAIAAASILAKVWRDELIVSLAQKYPEYNLASNKGYPTADHLLAIQKYGISDEHRRSFKSCQNVPSLKLDRSIAQS